MPNGCTGSVYHVRLVVVGSSTQVGMGPGYCWPGGYTGGVLPSHCSRLREGSRQRSGPRKPCKGWSGWSGARNTLRGHPPASDPPRKRGPLPAVAGRRWALKAASGPITARFHVKYCKVSQNDEVSPKSMHKASHSPYIQNGLQISPLEILGFPYSAAFSPKELMAHFDPYLRLSVKMTKCRQCVHPPVTRKGRVRYPHTSRSKLLLGRAPHLTLSAVFSTDLFLHVLQEIMTETGVWTWTSNEACGRSILGSILGPIFSKTGPKFSKTGPIFSKTGPKLSKTS